MLTVFDNDLSAVPADKASVTVAHTAAVPPADIAVNDAVLFPNVANGESLTLVVPVDTYSGQIVPTGEEGPAILGPLDLTVEGGSLNRVFAVGNPEDDTMNVVHVPEFAKEGSETPEVGDRTAVDRVTTGRMANGRTVGGLVAACLLLAGRGSSPEPTPAAAAVIAPDQSEATTDAGQAEESLIELTPSQRGKLEIPEDVFRLGWWDGGAYVNDPFGSMVIAGHIDSAEQGLGWLARAANTGAFPGEDRSVGPAFSARVEKLREDRLRSLGYEVVGLHGRYAFGPRRW